MPIYSGQCRHVRGKDAAKILPAPLAAAGQVATDLCRSRAQ